jgi:transposase-like protein
MHQNARLTRLGRAELVRRKAEGQPVAGVAAALGVTPKTVRKWVARYWQVNSAGPKQASPFPGSCRDGGGHPGVLGCSPKLAKRGSADQMRLKIEGVVDRSVAGEETLG